MKKFTLIAFLTLLFLGSTYSQEEKFFRLGIYGSPSAAWLKSGTKSHTSEGIKLGFGYGLMTEFSISDHYAFSTGIGSFYSGGKLKYIYDDTMNTTTFRVQYIEIPITMKMKTNEINYMTYFATFGGALDARIKSFADESLASTGGSPLPSRDDIEINSDINIFRASFVIGLGVEYSLGGSTAAIASVNFNNGLTNMFKKKSDNYKNINAKNNFVTLNIGIIF